MKILFLTLNTEYGEFSQLSLSQEQLYKGLLWESDKEKTIQNNLR